MYPGCLPDVQVRASRFDFKGSRRRLMNDRVCQSVVLPWRDEVCLVSNLRLACLALMTTACLFALPGVQGQEAESAVAAEEHTSELQSLRHLVCRLLLEKKKTRKT